MIFTYSYSRFWIFNEGEEVAFKNSHLVNLLFFVEKLHHSQTITELIIQSGAFLNILEDAWWGTEAL